MLAPTASAQASPAHGMSRGEAAPPLEHLQLQLPRRDHGACPPCCEAAASRCTPEQPQVRGTPARHAFEGGWGGASAAAPRRTVLPRHEARRLEQRSPREVLPAQALERQHGRWHSRGARAVPPARCSPRRAAPAAPVPSASKATCHLARGDRSSSVARSWRPMRCEQPWAKDEAQLEGELGPSSRFDWPHAQTMNTLVRSVHKGRTRTVHQGYSGYTKGTVTNSATLCNSLGA